MNILNLVEIILIVAIWGIANMDRSNADFAKPDMTCIGKYKMYYINRFMKIMNRSFSPLHCEHCEEMPETIVLNNTGETIEIYFKYSDVDSIPTISQGPLADKGAYRFEYAYFSWVISLPELWDATSISFWAEMHLVFYNTKHGDYETSMDKREGIAVLTTVFKVRPWISNKEFDLIADGLPAVRKGQSDTSIQTFPLFQLLPDILNEYYTYVGGQALPSEYTKCISEGNVIWIEFEQALKITPKQVSKFQELRNSYSVPLDGVIKEFDQPKTIIYKSTDSLDALAAAANQQDLSFLYGTTIFLLFRYMEI